MAGLHIRVAQDAGLFRIVCHATTPVGNNTVGVSWATAIVNAGFNKTELPDGDGTAGTISATEKSQIAAGTTYEAAEDWDPGNDWGSLSGAQQQARVQAEATRVTNDRATVLQRKLKYFGFTV